MPIDEFSMKNKDGSHMDDTALKAGIICVGTELLMGTTVNTNSAFISTKLSELGIGVYYHISVGDNIERIVSSVKSIVDEVDLVIFTGGLGPTQDDLTKDGVAKFLDVSLELNHEVKENLIKRFESLGKKMPESNLRQAYFPYGSTLLNNEKGTAPGCYIEHNGKSFALLPGPPNEMKSMFEDSLMAILLDKSNKSLYSDYIKIFGVGESVIEEQIMDIIDHQSNPTVATYANDGDVAVRVTAFGSSRETAMAIAESTTREIADRFKENVFSLENKSLQEVLVMKMIESKKTLSIAESCTGGLLSSLISSIPGASNVLDRTYVTYSNEAKIQDLGVSTDTLERFGAVSAETAIEMVKGLSKKTDCDFHISITGIAGPGGGTLEKPVGLVYIGIMDSKLDVFKSVRLDLSGTREKIQLLSAQNAIFQLMKMMVFNCM